MSDDSESKEVVTVEAKVPFWQKFRDNFFGSVTQDVNQVSAAVKSIQDTLRPFLKEIAFDENKPYVEPELTMEFISEFSRDPEHIRVAGEKYRKMLQGVENRNFWRL